MHIDKEVRALTTYFNNLPLSIKSGLACKTQLPRSSSFFFVLLRVWNLEQWGLRRPKAPQWWQTMCLGLLSFLGRDLAIWFCFLFNIEHWGFMWPITPQWWQVGTNLDSLKFLGWDLNEGLGLKVFLSTFWFLFYRGMCTDLSLEVELTIGTRSSNTIWLQQRFSSLLEIGSAIKHLACILRDSFSHLRSLTSLLDKTSLASNFIFKHSNSLIFSKKISASFLYFSTNLLDSLSLAIKSSFSLVNLLKFSWNFLNFFSRVWHLEY